MCFGLCGGEGEFWGSRLQDQNRQLRLHSGDAVFVRELRGMRLSRKMLVDDRADQVCRDSWPGIRSTSDPT